MPVRSTLAQASLKFLQRQPVRFVLVIEPLSNFAPIVCVVRMTQLKGVSDEFCLLAVIEGRYFAFQLLKTHAGSLTRRAIAQAPQNGYDVLVEKR